MSLTDEERNTLVRLYLERSDRTMEELEVAISAQKWGMAANRMYYAVFHAVTALFVSDGLPVGTHRGAKATLGQYYVLPGKISPEHSRLFAKLETLRDKADYNILFLAKEEDVMPCYDSAQKFINVIKALVSV